MDEYHKNSDTAIALIVNAYDKAMQDINDDIKKIFYRFAKNGKITESEARELLNSNISPKEVKSIRSKVGQIQDEDLKAYMLAQLNMRAYKARITRLEALKESIYINCKIAADTEIKQNTLSYIDNMNNAYHRNIYDIQKGTRLGFSFAEMPTDTIEEILKNNWSGKHYSKRIWHNTDILAEKLAETITSGLMSGQSSRRMAKEIEDLSDDGKYAAERLIRTETTYVCNMAEIESYKECDIQKYVFVATLDLRTSQICREHDKKVYEVSKAVPGENLPPLHPHCRSTTIAYIDEETLNKLQRRARDPETGKSYILPHNMSYNEWYKKYVVEKHGAKKAEIFEKMIKNKSSDRKMYREYKAIIGENNIESFEEFRKTKYNKTNEWQTMKDYYKARTQGNISAFSSYGDYKSVISELSNKLIGIKTSDGIEIKSYSKHMIDRILGASNDPKTGLPRSGTTVEGVLDALRNPIKITETKARKLDKIAETSKKYIGEKSTVSINPNTGNLIQSNPTDKDKVRRLKSV